MLTNQLATKIDVGDCWHWTAARDRKGYGMVRILGVLRKAHHVVWESLVGPLPEGLEPDHLCRNTSCVNPDHIEWVTASVNMKRQQGSDRNMACGHSVLARRPGRNDCRPCHNMREHRRKKEQ